MMDERTLPLTGIAGERLSARLAALLARVQQQARRGDLALATDVLLALADYLAEHAGYVAAHAEQLPRGMAERLCTLANQHADMLREGAADLRRMEAGTA